MYQNFEVSLQLVTLSYEMTQVYVMPASCSSLHKLFFSVIEKYTPIVYDSYEAVTMRCYSRIVDIGTT